MRAAARDDLDCLSPALERQQRLDRHGQNVPGAFAFERHDHRRAVEPVTLRRVDQPDDDGDRRVAGFALRCRRGLGDLPDGDDPAAHETAGRKLDPHRGADASELLLSRIEVDVDNGRRPGHLEHGDAGLHLRADGCLDPADTAGTRKEDGISRRHHAGLRDTEGVLPRPYGGRSVGVERLVDRHRARVVAELDEVPLELLDILAVRGADGELPPERHGPVEQPHASRVHVVERAPPEHDRALLRQPRHDTGRGADERTRLAVAEGPVDVVAEHEIAAGDCRRRDSAGAGRRLGGRIGPPRPHDDGTETDDGDSGGRTHDEQSPHPSPPPAARPARNSIASSRIS